jgi:hypothetical protein
MHWWGCIPPTESEPTSTGVWINHDTICQSNSKRKDKESTLEPDIHSSTPVIFTRVVGVSVRPASSSKVHRSRIIVSPAEDIGTEKLSSSGPCTGRESVRSRTPLTESNFKLHSQCVHPARPVFDVIIASTHRSSKDKQVGKDSNRILPILI